MVGKTDRKKGHSAVQAEAKCLAKSRYKKVSKHLQNKTTNTVRGQNKKKKQKYIRRYLWNGNRETKGRNKNITTKY